MKKTILFTLGSVLLLSFALLSAGASSVSPDAEIAPAAAVTLDATCSQGASASLDWPLRPVFAGMGPSTGGRCVTCDEHTDCFGVCGNPFGFCSIDLAQVCGFNPFDRFCFCE